MLSANFDGVDSVLSGNALVIASTTSVVIALTWGGVTFSWSSAHVLVPLIVGLVGIVAFFAYEMFVAKVPMVSLVFCWC